VHAGEEQTCVRATKEERDTVPESASGTKASAQPMHSTAATAIDVFIALERKRGHVCVSCTCKRFRESPQHLPRQPPAIAGPTKWGTGASCCAWMSPCLIWLILWEG
jgi:hypothetical protein